MAMREIDETEFLNNQKLKDTVAKLLAKPEAAVLVERALKLVDPTAKTPRLDQQAMVTAPVEEITKKFDELSKQVADDKAEREKRDTLSALSSRVETGIAQLRADGWTDDGISGVRKLMEEKGLLDPADAAAIFEKMHPPQSPATPSGSSQWNFIESVPTDDNELKALVASKGESNPVVDRMAHDALVEFRGLTRR